MTFEEARALFPVLDRYAYLQAGSVGPLARGTIDAMRASEERGLEEGRGSITQFMRLLEAREELRAELAALVGVDVDRSRSPLRRRTGATSCSPDSICSPTTRSSRRPTSTSDSSGRSTCRARRSWSSNPIRSGSSTPVTPRTRLIALSHVLWTTGAALPVHELRVDRGLPILVDGAQSVGAHPGRRGRPRLLHGLRTEVALRAGGDRRARRRRPGRPPRWPSELPLAAGLRAGRQRSSRRTAPRDSTPTSRRTRSSRGCERRSRAIPSLGARACSRDGRALPRRGSRSRATMSSFRRNAPRSSPGALRWRSPRPSSSDWRTRE